MTNLLLLAMLFIPLVTGAQTPAETYDPVVTRYTCAPPDCQPDPEFAYQLPTGAWWTETRLTTDAGAIVILRPMANCTGPHTVRVYRSLEHARPIARAEIVLPSSHSALRQADT